MVIKAVVDIPVGWAAGIITEITPHLHELAYGNLRFAHTLWQEGEDTVTNLAIVYELPGGSTCQINVMRHETSATYSYLTLDTHEEHHTASLVDTEHMVREAVARIPAIRRQRLYDEIDNRASKGATRHMLLHWLKSLLKFEEIYGGKVTPEEMQQGIAYFTQHHHRQPPSTSGIEHHS